MTPAISAFLQTLRDLFLPPDHRSEWHQVEMSTASLLSQLLLRSRATISRTDPGTKPEKTVKLHKGRNTIHFLMTESDISLKRAKMTQFKIFLVVVPVRNRIDQAETMRLHFRVLFFQGEHFRFFHSFLHFDQSRSRLCFPRHEMEEIPRPSLCHWDESWEEAVQLANLLLPGTWHKLVPVAVNKVWQFLSVSSNAMFLCLLVEILFLQCHFGNECKLGVSSPPKASLATLVDHVTESHVTLRVVRSREPTIGQNCSSRFNGCNNNYQLIYSK